jgi:hypothetical protein
LYATFTPRSAQPVLLKNAVMLSISIRDEIQGYSAISRTILAIGIAILLVLINWQKTGKPETNDM